MYLGALNNSGAADSRYFVGDIYYCKIYQNNALVRDLIPVIRNSDNVIGLYDTVNKKFYTNSGTGTFAGTSGWTVASDKKTATKNVTYNTDYGNLPEPTRTGYTFVGWYKETGFTNKVESTTTVTTASNHTLYAK